MKRAKGDWWAKIPESVIRHPDTNFVDIAVYSVLALHADWKTGYCHPNYKTMKELLKIGGTTLKASIRQLAKLGFIEYASGQKRRTVNMYRLLPAHITSPASGLPIAPNRYTDRRAVVPDRAAVVPNRTVTSPDAGLSTSPDAGQEQAPGLTSSIKKRTINETGTTTTTTASNSPSITPPLKGIDGVGEGYGANMPATSDTAAEILKLYQAFQSKHPNFTKYNLKQASASMTKEIMNSGITPEQFAQVLDIAGKSDWFCNTFAGGLSWFFQNMKGSVQPRYEYVLEGHFFTKKQAASVKTQDLNADGSWTTETKEAVRDGLKGFRTMDDFMAERKKEREREHK